MREKTSIDVKRALEKLSPPSDLGSEYKLLIFNIDQHKDRSLLLRLLREGKVFRKIDFLEEQKKELAEVQSPREFGKTHSGKQTRVNIEEGAWIFYPWNGFLVHVLGERDFYTLRVSRNKNLILDKEQEMFKNARIGIAGLNVGNPGALCIALEGGAYNMKFADLDLLSLSNLNRFRASISDLGVNKAILSARQIYEVDPYMSIDVFEKGLQPDNIYQFLLEPRLDLIIEEMDNMKLKIEIRQRAKEYKIPVLMVTGNGPNVIVDVERYDLDQSIPIMNGYLKKDVIEGVLALDRDKPDRDKIILLARDFMGKEHLTSRLRDSFKLIGKDLAGIPQIAESSFLRGATLCYFARSIITGVNIPSGRYTINIDEVV